MSNQITKVKTNYVRLSDPKRFKKLIAMCSTDDDDLEIITCKENGETKYGFCADSEIRGLRIPNNDCENSNRKSCEGCKNYKNCEEDDCEYDLFLKKLQETIAPGDALVIMTIENEKLIRMACYIEIVTRDAIEGISMYDEAEKLVQKLLNNPEWSIE